MVELQTGLLQMVPNVPTLQVTQQRDVMYTTLSSARTLQSGNNQSQVPTNAKREQDNNNGY